MAEKKVPAEKSRFRLRSLEQSERRAVIEVFAREFGRMLRADSYEPDAGRKEVVERVSKELGRKIDVRQFDSLLKAMHDDGYVRLAYHRLSDRAYDLQRAHPNLDNVTVVAGNDPELFGQAAAEEFIREMFRIAGENRTASGSGAPPVLKVGVISGSTTGHVVRSAVNLDWPKDLGLSARELPEVRVFALNVCLTVPEHLSGNATILAHELAEKISHDGGRAFAYGLSAPLLVALDELEEVDESPQTFDVVRHTEPYRVRNKLRQTGMLEDDRELNQHDTELDIVLTGVGELPQSEERSRRQPATDDAAVDSEGSIFYNLAKQFGIDMDQMIKDDNLVGDIAFAAINWNGEIIPLRRPIGPNGQESEFIFYSAVQPRVLENMAGQRDKSVILVARHSKKKNKLPAIVASIGRDRHRYASRIVIDEETARGLAQTF